MKSNIQLYQGDCLEVMKNIPDKSVDLTVTSPPYDNLRDYNNGVLEWTENQWKPILLEIYRLTKDGGTVVWIVSDATVKGSETGTSFQQALFAKEIGFNLHDTMIWNKGGFSAVGALKTRYAPVFEYMFIFTKGKIKTFNPLIDRPNKIANKKVTKSKRQRDGSIVKGTPYVSREFGQRFNIWDCPPHRQKGSECHPAPFPIGLIQDHILSWSNEGDIVMDCFMGSGTTGVSAKNLNRDFIGIEKDEGYFKTAEDRIYSTVSV